MKFSAIKIQENLDSLIKEASIVTVMLTGGRSAEKLYNEWKKIPSFRDISNTVFYLGDERCVPIYHVDSNYRMIMKTLFSDGIPNNCIIHRIHAEVKNIDIAAKKYSTILPTNIDILLLGVGDDGHVASLFPHAPILHEKNKSCLPVKDPKLPCHRLTITPLVIKNARKVYLLVPGLVKTKVMHKYLQDPANINALPVRLVDNPIWCYD